MNARKLLPVLLVVALLCGCATTPAGSTAATTVATVPAPATDPTPATEPGSVTLAIYLCGSDLESRAGMASKNITEMLSAQLPENVTVLIQTGGTKAWRGHNIPADRSCRYRVHDGRLELLEEGPAVNMGLSASLEDFLLWADRNYPARQRGLILWDHGGGSVKGVCIDEQHHNDPLTLPETAAALQTACRVSGSKYEFVGFDACLMATYDAARAVAPYAHRMIASQELEPAGGWNYTAVLSALGQPDFYDRVLRSYGQKQARRATHTLSVVDLAGLPRLEAAVSAFADRVDGELGLVGKLLSQAKEFGTEGHPGRGTNLFDLGLLLQQLGIDHGFDGFITTQNGPVHADATGISIYFPTENSRELDAYEAVCTDGDYMDFLYGYFSGQPATTISFSAPAFLNGGKLAFTITPESAPYVQEVGYEVQGFAGLSQTYRVYSIGTDADVTAQGNTYTVNFDGDWVYLNDCLLHTDIYEAGDRVLYSAPVKINEEFANLLFTYEKATRTICQEGYVMMGDITSRIYSLREGDVITVLYEQRQEKGEIHYLEEGEVTWDASAGFEIRPLPADFYNCLPYVEDIYGNVYYSCLSFYYYDGQVCKLQDIISEAHLDPIRSGE